MPDCTRKNLLGIFHVWSNRGIKKSSKNLKVCFFSYLFIRSDQRIN